MTTFDRDLIEPGEIEAGVLRIFDDVWRWSKTRQAFGRTVTVKVKYGDFQQITRSRDYPIAVATQEALQQLAPELIQSVLSPQKGVLAGRRDGIEFAELEALAPSEQLIFAEVVA